MREIDLVDRDMTGRSTAVTGIEQERSSFRGGYAGIIGESDAMCRIYRLIERVAPTDSIVMLTGETGTGKGVVARAIHACSTRKDGAFIQINCGAIPAQLLESELFGHVKGAFTGAVSAKPGKFELAEGGTIFLDEIGDMSPDLQVKILRVLEEREFEPVGGSATRKADVRIIAATHRDLEKSVAEGVFREDLYYRLMVIPLRLPPLRERADDIPLLVDHFAGDFKKTQGSGPAGFSKEAMDYLRAYDWPGNIRELRNMVQRTMILKESGIVTPEDLPVRITGIIPLTVPDAAAFLEDGICLNTMVTELERSLILQCLEKTHWVKNEAAKLLGVKRTTLVEKIKRLGLRPAEEAQAA